MNEFEDNPLDLDGDGDEITEMCLFFDDEGKRKNSGDKPSGEKGSCVILLAMGSSIGLMVWGVAKTLV